MIIRIIFPNPLNVSLQLGDIAYFCTTQDVGPQQKFGAHATAGQEDIIKIGEVVEIMPFDNFLQESYIDCDMDDDLIAQFGTPNIGDFIMFSKDNKVNLSSALGYYAEVKLKNNSEEKAELFAVGTDFVESSK